MTSAGPTSSGTGSLSIATAPRGGATGGVIQRLRPGGEAEALGLQVGDVILAIDGHAIHDVIDYQFYAAEDEIEILVERGEVRFTVHAEGGIPLGIEFGEPSFDGIHRCANHCVFCFVDRLPPSLRASLYVKDDDYRYSTMYGNFITLTNLKNRDWRRIIEQHISPLHVSVHCTDTDVRRVLLGNPKAAGVLPQLRQLIDAGIEVHAQVVFCPGFNDGSVLATTIDDLATLYPGVRTVGVVPVAVSARRNGRAAGEDPCLPDPSRPRLRAVTPGDAAAAIAEVRVRQRECRRALGVGFVYLADEFYLLAGQPLPSARYYDGFPQYENGIGMARSLKDSWASFRRRLTAMPKPPPRRVTVACGRLIEPLLRELLHDLASVSGWDIQLVPLDNSLFGPAVTVSGLLPGKAIINALSGRDLGDCLVLPRSMLDNGGNRCLDDVTVGDLQSALGVRITFAHNIRELFRLCAKLS